MKDWNKEMLSRLKNIRPEYNYVNFKFINSKTKVKIGCPKHGEFEALTHQILNGSQCPKCAYEQRAKKKTSNAESFIKKAIDIHGDKYDYSEVVYKKSNQKVKLFCNKCKEYFYITPNDHLNRRGHSVQCSLSDSREDFIKKAKEVHGDKYLYDSVKYVNNNTKITVICPIHGEWETLPRSITSGVGCPECAIERRTSFLTNTKEEFIEKAQALHGNKLDYTKVIYKGSRKKVKITCPIHGEFEQTPVSHLNTKYGCPECGFAEMFSKKESQQEKDLFEFVYSIYNKEIIQHKKFCENDKYKYEVDIFIPEKNIGIDLNRTYWHSSVFTDRLYHFNKSKWFEDQGIRIIHVWEYMWQDDGKKEIYKSIISNALGLSKHRIFARKTYLEKHLKINKEIRDFSEQNSLHGHRNAKMYYLLKDKETDETLQLYSFGNPYFVKNKREGEIECIRGITKINTNVIGGFSKILKNLLKDNSDIKSILYYVDYNTHIGNSMDNNDFKFEKYTGPGMRNLCLTSNSRSKYNNINGVFNRIPSRHMEIKTDIENKEVASLFDSGTKRYRLIINSPEFIE